MLQPRTCLFSATFTFPKCFPYFKVHFECHRCRHHSPTPKEANQCSATDCMCNVEKIRYSTLLNFSFLLWNILVTTSMTLVFLCGLNQTQKIKMPLPVQGKYPVIKRLCLLINYYTPHRLKFLYIVHSNIHSNAMKEAPLLFHLQT